MANHLKIPPNTGSETNNKFLVQISGITGNLQRFAFKIVEDMTPWVSPTRFMYTSNRQIDTDTGSGANGFILQNGVTSTNSNNITDTKINGIPASILDMFQAKADDVIEFRDTGFISDGCIAAFARFNRWGHFSDLAVYWIEITDDAGTHRIDMSSSNGTLNEFTSDTGALTLKLFTAPTDNSQWQYYTDAPLNTGEARVGMGWASSIRDYDSLTDWRLAVENSGIHETALCRGQLLGAFVPPSGTFLQGYHLKGMVPFNGSNRDEIAFCVGASNLCRPQQNCDGVIEDIRWTGTTTNGGAHETMNISYGSVARRCIIEKTKSGTAVYEGANHAPPVSPLFENCVIRSPFGSATNTHSAGTLRLHNCTIEAQNLCSIGRGVRAEARNNIVIGTAISAESTAPANITDNATFANDPLVTNQREPAYVITDDSDIMDMSDNGDYRTKAISQFSPLGLGAFNKLRTDGNVLVGMGWSKFERDYEGLNNWRDDTQYLGTHETALCRGMLTSGFTPANDGYTAGCHIKGMVQFDGTNRNELAYVQGGTLGHRISIHSSITANVDDIRLTYTTTNTTAANPVGGDSTHWLRGIIERPHGHILFGAGGNSTAVGALYENCVLHSGTNIGRVINTHNYGKVRLLNSLVIGGAEAYVGRFSTVAAGRPSVKNCFFVNAIILSNNTNDTDIMDNAAAYDESTAGSSTHQPLFENLTLDELVDFANGDYRIKQTSDLHALNIGAFFETAVDGVTVLQMWNGTEWVTAPVKMWNGTEWVPAPMKKWNGMQWVSA